MINMSIDENNAYRITGRLAFPRLIGSEGEKKAIEVVVDEFRKAGYDNIQREKFKTSFANWIYARYIFFPLGGFLILFGLLPFISNWINSFLTFDIKIYSILTWLTLIGFFIAGYKSLGMVNSSTITVMKDESKNYETENIYVNLKSKNSKAKIVYMAHWDSKSQNFSSIVRIFILIVAIFGDILILLLYFVLSIVEFFIPIDILVLDYILLIVCIVLAIVGILNFFNKTANKSPGAIDNAASVGTVIELARYFKSNPLDNVDFIFLSTSSEELSSQADKLYESVSYFKTTQEELDLYSINEIEDQIKKFQDMLVSLKKKQKDTVKELKKDVEKRSSGKKENNPKGKKINLDQDEKTDKDYEKF